MPVIRSTKNGKPCYKVQNTDHCYPYTAGDEASRKRTYNAAVKQLRAIESSKYRRKTR
ncbi:hypothetical protein VPHG_00141 [Vibrio phage 11895-B1]|uniref:hypothetical protein n=1 Tax=Vibrio phage 11895-B1 TaxID=754075 RepID=UPI0002C0E278|nr:hypothetical protein VPHG_00141 [Vibrio phage 11895-B1]AGH32206.1 hypothetical protein VPHG_00141 [Vibrio phage 11895-B1]